MKKHPKWITGITFIPFVKKVSTMMRTSNIKKQGMLQQANAGVLQSDLDKKLQFQDIIQTTLRTDLVIQLAATKRFVIMELIVPWGNDASAHMEWSNTNILCTKNVDGKLGCSHQVWCWGFPAQSVWTTLSSLDIVGKQHRAAVKALGQAVERASSWLWLTRDQENWKG